MNARSSLPPLLVVEDHDATRRTTVRVLEMKIPVIAARSVAEARRLAPVAQRLAGAVLDERLPDGRGTELVPALRRGDPKLPVLVLTGEAEPDVIRRAQLVDAQFLLKPSPAANLLAFAERCLRRVAPLLSYADKQGLSPRETELLGHLLAGHAIKQLPEIMGVRPATIKSFLERILRKTRGGRTEWIVAELRRRRSE